MAHETILRAWSEELIQLGVACHISLLVSDPHHSSRWLATAGGGEGPTSSMILQFGCERLGTKSSSSDSGWPGEVAGWTIGSGDLDTDGGRELYRL